MLEKLAALLPSELIVTIWKWLPKSVKLRRFLAWRANTRFVAGVVGLIYAENGDLLIVKHTYKATPWGLPSGALRREQPFEGLKREIREETGFEIRPEKILDVVYSGKPSELLIIIRAKLLGGLFVPSPEVSEFDFIRPGESLERLPKAQRSIVYKYGLHNKIYKKGFEE
ncbi:MAG: NUDIX domain-containing protein [Clostridiales bacterium]|jgi:8-oxo-dGTP pyrophosphatase MutT (NUDIX family)|nr:NUDIX domain-containing protein [Clostridiales bacterium]